VKQRRLKGRNDEKKEKRKKNRKKEERRGLMDDVTILW